MPNNRGLDVLCHTSIDAYPMTYIRACCADLESAGQPVHKSGGSGWVLTMFVMVAEMFGLGILTLPADFARLGW